MWYHSVLPVIFPFMFLSTLTLRILDADSLPEAFSRPLTRLFGCTAYGAFVILAGYLCGFPMGAKLTGDLYREKKITREEAHFLYGFANNLSPGFILTYLASEQMLLPNQAGYFLLQILGASLLKGWIEARKRKPFQPLPAAPQNKPAEKLTFSMVDDCINDAVSNVLRLGAYIILFAILSGAFMQLLQSTNPIILLLLSSIEVTNGIRLLSESSLPQTVKYVSVCAAAAFGGLSALAQSAGIARMDSETLFYYLKSRVKITLLATLLSIAVLILNTYI